SPISSQMVSIPGASLAVNSNMLHGLVANPTQVHTQSMLNGGHMYTSAEEYTSMQSHYAVQAASAPPPPPPPPSTQTQTQPPTSAPQTPNSSSSKKRKV